LFANNVRNSRAGAQGGVAMTYRSIWLRTEPATRTGRPAEWTREQITAAAIAVADGDGLGAVTMRRVAARLGTGAASLYRYLETRDDLVDLMVDSVFGGFEHAPDSDDWRAGIVTDHMRQLQLMRDHPWLLDAIHARPPIGPNAGDVVERTLARMANHPAPGGRKLETVGVLAGMVQTYAANERPGGGVLDKDFVAVQAQLMQKTVSDGKHPHLAAALIDAASAPPDSPDDQLARALRLVLDGMLP
jgi:AcrR family transcriptional regulator